MPKTDYVQIKEYTALDIDRDLIHGLSIDQPLCMLYEDMLSLEFTGWIVGNTNPVISLEILSNHQPVNIIRVHQARPDVAEYYPDYPYTERCGFNQRIGVLGLPSVFELTVNAIIKTGDEKQHIPIALIKGEWNIEALPCQVKRQPLMVTGLARSGTTWMMRLLSEVPGITVPAMYPYETRPAVYWMHTMKVLTDPADYIFSTVPDGFEINMQTVGHNPYNHPDFIERFDDPKSMRSWHGMKQIKRYMRFCKENIDEYYDVVESGQKQKACIFFAEKMLPSHMQNIFYSTYENAKEIILVRDFRDLICSAMAFNKRRNTRQFGRQLADSDEQWIRNIRNRGVARILRCVEERKDHALFIHYEDLIKSPEDTLREICAYLELNIPESELGKIHNRARQATRSLNFHQTSDDPGKSVERWRTDMDEDTKLLCKDVLGEALDKLGYAVD